jgi:hypothetical protein
MPKPRIRRLSPGLRRDPLSAEKINRITRLRTIDASGASLPTGRSFLNVTSIARVIASVRIALSRPTR